MLQGCHARIRHFMQLSRTLAEAVDAPQNDIADAAASLTRYFGEALPLHEEDENLTLFPRLYDAAPLGSPLREAAQTMVEQHRMIDELVAELLSLCGKIHCQPERLPSLAHPPAPGQLRSRSGLRIASQHGGDRHLSRPPALAPGQLEEITGEMQQRRRPPRQGIHFVRLNPRI